MNDATEKTVKCPRCTARVTGKFCAECGAPLTATRCPTCQTSLAPRARFCHACGRPMGAKPVGGGGGFDTAKAGWVVAGAALVVLVVVMAVQYGGGQNGGGSTAPLPGPSPFSTPAPDISQMTPREAANRLFDRIVRAAERGDSAEVSRFYTMAVGAYGLIGELDADARYHVGLLHTMAGNFAAVSIQLDSLQQSAPNHLFGPMLEYTVAQLSGDRDGMQQAYRRFLSNYDSEITTGNQDYVDHELAVAAFLDAARSEAN